MRGLFALCLLLVGCEKSPVRELSNEAYVWQSPSRTEVGESVDAAKDFFSAFHFRAAELKWSGERFLIEEVVDELPVPSCGLVVRIGASASSLDWTPDRIGEVAGVFHKLAKLNPVEIQCDFDCPQSRLDSYLELLGELQKVCGEVPVVPTVLPSWLDEPAFKRLVGSLDHELGYVLQVHSLVLPDGPHEQPVIFDPVASELYVEKAAALGGAFRVAMATYGCEVRFDDEGRIVDVVSEDVGSLDGGFTSRSFTLADPVASARLVKSWKEDPPAGMAGIVWYRLPVSTDRRNWPIEVLRLVAEGEEREETVLPELSGESGTRDIFFENKGEFPTMLPSGFAIGSPAKAADGVGPYRIEITEDGFAFRLRGDVWPWLFPGQKVVCGWMISSDESVEVDIVVTE